MKQRFFFFLTLILSAVMLLAAPCAADESTRSPERENVFDAAFARKKLQIEITSRRELGGESGLKPSKLDGENLAQLYRELGVPIFSGTALRFTDTVGQKIYNSLFVYTDKGANTYLNAFRACISTFLGEDTLNRYRMVRSNARWFEKKGTEYIEDFKKFDSAFYAGHSSIWKKADEIIARFKKYNLSHPGEDRKGTDLIYTSLTIENGGLNTFFSITGPRASFKNKLHDLDFHVKVAKRQIKEYPNDIKTVMGEIDKVRNMLAELRARIMTDPECSAEINSLLDQDQAVLDNLARTCEEMNDRLDFLQKSDEAAPLIKNDPEQAKYAFQKGPSGDLPEYEQKAVRAFQWLKKEIDTYNDYIIKTLK